MSIIDKTYFVKDINIPDSDYSDLTAYITRYEKEILIKLLGYELGTLVLAYNALTSPQRIIDIVEGSEYTVGDYTVKWNGLKNTDKVSLIAYYVFYWWARNNATFTGTIGEMKSVGENAENAKLNQRLSNAWLRMTDLAQATEYPYHSLYCFLKENESDYPEWEFTELGTVNGFDL
jgi:hypothetical protein